MDIIQLKSGSWEYSFGFNGRTQVGTRSSHKEAMIAMREDMDLAKAFWRDYEE